MVHSAAWVTSSSQRSADVKVVAVEPQTSPVLSEGHGGPHKIQGIGAGFVPDTLDTKVYDEILPVANEAAFSNANDIAKTEAYPRRYLFRRRSCSRN